MEMENQPVFVSLAEELIRDIVDNAQVFYDWLLENKKETSLLPNLTYCVFGLGDHYYPKYNVIGKVSVRPLSSTPQ